MQSTNEKLSLLADMIAFAIVDGKLHDREYQFITLVAQELQIDKEILNQLFHQEHATEVVKNEFERIQHFYRLALLMFCDGVLHEREQIKINEMGLFMGLSPFAIKRVLKAMKESPSHMVSPQFLLDVFNEQLN
ncbi:MAG: excinuclease ABC subunit B [Flavobacterium sp.]|jgi:hypothetical protein|nr:excinuclease ABC subunit B [Flavobacterium sp.]